MNIHSLLQADLFLQVSGITSGRLESILAAVIGLFSVIIGIRAFRGHHGSGRIGAIVGLLLGLIGTILSGLHLARSYSAEFGTGSGKAGAIVALALGLIGIVLGGFALARSRRIVIRSNSESKTYGEKK